VCIVTSENLRLADLTCVINVRNGEKYIEETLASILTQTLAVKILVIDNQSTDSTKDICSRFQNFLDFVPTPVKMTLGEARNFGLSRVNSKYLAFLDSDDLWEPAFVENHLNLHKSHSECIFSSSLSFIIDENSQKYPNSSQTYLKKVEFYGYMKADSLADLLILGMTAPWCSYVFSTAKLKEVGGFDLNLEFAEDLEVLCKLALIGVGYRLGSPLCSYRVSQNQTSRRLSSDVIYGEIFRIRQRYSNELQLDSQFLLNEDSKKKKIVWALRKALEQPGFSSVFGVAKIFLYPMNFVRFFKLLILLIGRR
jgi:glycosyltransferase involved in cell wall biosynthesis